MGSRRRSPSAPQWQVILEEIRSENRATLETVLAFRSEFGARMDRTDQVLGELRQDHSRALAEHGRTIAEHSGAISELRIELRENTVELRSLSQRVDTLNRIEDRVAALEKHAFGAGGGSTPTPA